MPLRDGSETTGVKRQILPALVLATGESPRRLSGTVGSAYARSLRESEFRPDLTVGSREKVEKPAPNTRYVRGRVFEEKPVAELLSEHGFAGECSTSHLKAARGKEKRRKCAQTRQGREKSGHKAK